MPDTNHIPTFLLLDARPRTEGTPLTATGYALALALVDELRRGGAEPGDLTPQTEAVYALVELIDEYEHTVAPPRIVGYETRLEVSPIYSR